MVAAGEVTLNGVTCLKTSTGVGDDDSLVVADLTRRVSRAADKLAGALDDFGLEVGGIALDAGASTGGFTEILLERGCERVYAVDVGHGQLHPRLAGDPRVHSRERLNLRELTSADLDHQVMDVVVADLSFISLTVVLRPLLSVTGPDPVVVLMIKPQFEVGRGGHDGQGVVSDPARREAAIRSVVEAAAELGWTCRARVPSRVAGESGNVEEFVHLVRRGSGPVEPTAS